MLNMLTFTWFIISVRDECYIGARLNDTLHRHGLLFRSVTAVLGLDCQIHGEVNPLAIPLPLFG
jgi:hypothetical protein